MAPSVDRLARADVAFDGTVDKISGNNVEMRVDSWFTKGADESVIITTLRGHPHHRGDPDLPPGRPLPRGRRGHHRSSSAA